MELALCGVVMVADTSQECLENAQILMNEFKL